MCPSSGGGFLVEIVGGPLDGECEIVPEFCECGCGERLAAGALITVCHGFVEHCFAIARVEGWRAWAEPTRSRELTFAEVLGDA